MLKNYFCLEQNLNFIVAKVSSNLGISSKKQITQQTTFKRIVHRKLFY
jgi:hypothetical protein